MSAERIERAGRISASNTRLLHTRRSTRVCKIEQRLERTLRSRSDDRVDCALANVADRAEPEPDSLVADDSELVSRLVHVGRQQLEPDLPRFIDVLDDAVGVADLRRQQRGHEIGRMVDLEPRRVERDDRVGDGVRLVESIAAERLDLRRRSPR